MRGNRHGIRIAVAPRANRLKLWTKRAVVDETSLKALLEHLPVSWWEADVQLHVIDSGGGAFDDTPTAQRFLDTHAPGDPRAGTPQRPKPAIGRPSSTVVSSM